MKKPILILTAFLFVATSMFGANRYWRGTSSTSWWSSSNWSTTAGGSGGASVPGSNDKAIFTSTRNNPCSVNTNVNVRGIEIQSGYTSTVTQNSGKTITVGDYDFSIASGTFSGGDTIIVINGLLTISGGTFTSTSETMICQKYSKTGGTFSDNGGTVMFYSSFPNSSISGSTTFNNLEFVGNGHSYNIQNGTTLTVNGNLTISGLQRATLNDGTITVSGDINITNTSTDNSTGDATIVIIGTGTQNFTGPGMVDVGKTPKVTVAKPSGTLYLKSTLTIGDDFTYSTGTLDATTYSSTVCFNPSGGAMTISVSPALYNAKFFGGDFTIASGTTLTVNNMLSFAGSTNCKINTGNIDAKGDIIVTNLSSNGGGTGTVSIVGTGNQILSGSGTIGTGALPNVVINKSSGTLNLSSIISVAGDFTNTAGTISEGSSTLAFVKGFNGKTITGSLSLNNLTVSSSGSAETLNVGSSTIVTVNGTLTIAGTNSITINGGNIYAKGDVTVTNTGAGGGGSTVLTINGTSGQTLTGSGVAGQGRLPNLVINKSSGTLTLSSIISVGDDFTYTGGTVSQGTSTMVFCNTKNLDGQGTSSTMTFNKAYIYSGTRTLTGDLVVGDELKIYSGATLDQNSKFISVGGNWNNAGSFTESSTMVTFNGSAGQTLSKTSSPTEETFSKLCINKSGGSLTLNDILIISDSLKLTNGNIVATSTDYIRFNDNVKVSGASNSSFVEGYARKVGNDAFTFPMGKGTNNYHPIGITAPTGADEIFAAEYFNTTPAETGLKDAEIDQVSPCEYWVLTRVSGTSSVTPTLGWNTNQCLSNEGDLAVLMWDGTKWVSLGAGSKSYNAIGGMLTASLSVTPATAPLTFGTTKQSYALLKKKLDGGYFTAVGSKLRFKYEEDYSDTDGLLSFTIFKTADNSMVASNAHVQNVFKPVRLGDNRYSFDLSLINGGLSAGNYILEVTNEKSEKMYLRFKL